MLSFLRSSTERQSLADGDDRCLLVSSELLAILAMMPIDIDNASSTINVDLIPGHLR